MTNIERADDVVLRHWWLEVYESGAWRGLSKLQATAPESQMTRNPGTLKVVVVQNPALAGPPCSSNKPKTGTLPTCSVNLMRVLRRVKGSSAQGSYGQLRTARPQLRAASSWAQVKTASAQAWKRNWHLVRSLWCMSSVVLDIVSFAEDLAAET
jgi:hypothetical protein